MGPWGPLGGPGAPYGPFGGPWGPTWAPVAPGPHSGPDGGPARTFTFFSAHFPPFSGFWVPGPQKRRKKKSAPGQTTTTAGFAAKFCVKPRSRFWISCLKGRFRGQNGFGVPARRPRAPMFAGTGPGPPDPWGPRGPWGAQGGPWAPPGARFPKKGLFLKKIRNSLVPQSTRGRRANVYFFRREKFIWASHSTVLGIPRHLRYQFFETLLFPGVPGPGDPIFERS